MYLKHASISMTYLSLMGNLAIILECAFVSMRDPSHVCRHLYEGSNTSAEVYQSKMKQSVRQYLNGVTITSFFINNTYIINPGL